MSGCAPCVEQHALRLTWCNLYGLRWRGHSSMHLGELAEPAWRNNAREIYHIWPLRWAYPTMLFGEPHCSTKTMERFRNSVDEQGGSGFKKSGTFAETALFTG
eukprot:scaffold125812_cov22-Tisochrysis_lutea.AAC.1